MAVRALFYLKRIDERYLVYRKRLVFGIVPSFAFVIDERGKRELSVKFRKKVLKENEFLGCWFFMAVCMLIGRKTKTQTAKS